MRYFHQDDDENKGSFLNILTFLTLSNTVLMTIGYFGLFIYFRLTHVSLPFFPYALIVFGSLMVDIYRSFYLLDLRVKKQAMAYFKISAVYILVNFGMGLALVVFIKLGAAGKMSGQLIAQGCIMVILFFQLKKFLNFHIDLKQIKEAMKYALPILLAAYAYYPINNIDKIYLERLGNNYEFGYYNIGVNMAAYLSIFGVALNQAFEPDFFKFIVQKNRRKFLQYALLYMMLITIFVVLFLFLSKYIVSFLTAGRYTRAYTYANINAVAVVIISASGVVNTIIMGLQKAKFILAINIIGGIVAIIIYKILISKYGFWGGNYAKIAVGLVFLATQLAFVKYRNHRVLKYLKLT